MALNKQTSKIVMEDKTEGDSGDDSDDESQVLEESPCGRWQKRKERVAQRDVPGIDSAYLAMDTEEGVEVVWNEVYMLMDRDLKANLNEVKRVFDTLIQLDHANLVKFHNYWVVENNAALQMERVKVVFITEYMSSGSLKQFLSRAKNKPKTTDNLKHKSKTLKAWKRWCTQILSALSYLHSCEPSIIHGNLTCDTIFIQQNGLIKVGSVAPDAIIKNVKTTRRDLKKNLYYFPAECDRAEKVTTAVDIYSFGICALEMAVLEIQPTATTNETSPVITVDMISEILNSLEDKNQRDFIALCLDKDPKKRPTARQLLFNKVMFEVHPLKLLAAHILVQTFSDQNLRKDIWKRDPSCVIAEWHAPGLNKIQHWRISDSPVLELDKYLEDVRNGIYPLTAFTDSSGQISNTIARAVSPEVLDQLVKSETPEVVADIENRSCTVISCEVKPILENNSIANGSSNVILSNGHNLVNTLDGGDKVDSSEEKFHVHLVLKMEDKTNRDLQGEITKEEEAFGLVDELIEFGFINISDKDKVLNSLEEAMNKRYDGLSTSSAAVVI